MSYPTKGSLVLNEDEMSKLVMLFDMMTELANGDSVTRRTYTEAETSLSECQPIIDKMLDVLE